MPKTKLGPDWSNVLSQHGDSIEIKPRAKKPRATKPRPKVVTGISNAAPISDVLSTSGLAVGELRDPVENTEFSDDSQSASNESSGDRSDDFSPTRDKITQLKTLNTKHRLQTVHSNAVPMDADEMNDLAQQWTRAATRTNPTARFSAAVSIQKLNLGANPSEFPSMDDDDSDMDDIYRAATVKANLGALEFMEMSDLDGNQV